LAGSDISQQWESVREFGVKSGLRKGVGYGKVGELFCENATGKEMLVKMGCERYERG
jgi:hypothetical protein